MLFRPKIFPSRPHQLIFVALLFLAILQLPTYGVADNHDAGSQAAIEYWTLHGFAYGKDIIQNVGPLGFLSYPLIYTGILDEVKLLINVFLTSYLVFLLWTRSKHLPSTLRIPFLVCAGLFSAGDVMFYVLLLLLSHQLTFAIRPQVTIPAIITLALLALTKGTCFFIALLIVTTFVLGCIISRRFIYAATATAGFAASIMVIWIASGQSPALFPEFVRATASFSNGYNQAMTVFEPVSITISGLSILICCELPIYWRILCSIRNTRHDLPYFGRQILLSITELFILFVVWKHGFVRADAHVIIFFGYVLISNIWTLFRNESAFSSTINHPLNLPVKISAPVGAFTLFLALLSFGLASPNPNSVIWSTYSKISNNLWGIVNLRALFIELATETEKRRASMQLPETQALVKTQRIGYFGMYPARMLYNYFNYVSMPSTISFASWNDGIMRADASFLQDESRAPPYLLFDLHTVDNRLVAQDDSLAKLEILQRYKIAGSEKGSLLLHRSLPKEALSLTPISRHEYEIGKWIDVPQSSKPTWLRIKVEESLLAQFVGFVYKPSQYFIELTFKNGECKNYKFIPQMAATGFLISPLLLKSADFKAIWSQQGYHDYLNEALSSPSKVVGFKIGCDRQAILCGQRSIVAFEEVNGLNLGFQLDDTNRPKSGARLTLP